MSPFCQVTELDQEGGGEEEGQWGWPERLWERGLDR